MNSVATNKTQQYNTRTKDYIYKWRQKNMDKYRIINREGQAKYREKHTTGKFQVFIKPK